MSLAEATAHVLKIPDFYPGFSPPIKPTVHGRNMKEILCKSVCLKTTPEHRVNLVLWEWRSEYLKCVMYDINKLSLLSNSMHLQDFRSVTYVKTDTLKDPSSERDVCAATSSTAQLNFFVSQCLCLSLHHSKSGTGGHGCPTISHQPEASQPPQVFMNYRAKGIAIMFYKLFNKSRFKEWKYFTPQLMMQFGFKKAHSICVRIVTKYMGL